MAAALRAGLQARFAQAGKVGMVNMALEGLAESDLLQLDDEPKAAMVSNLPVVLSAPRPAEAGRPPRGSRKVAQPHFLESSDHDATLVVTSGTLYN